MTDFNALGRYTAAADAAEVAALRRLRAMSRVSMLVASQVNNPGLRLAVDFAALREALANAAAEDDALREAMRQANEVAGEAGKPVIGFVR